MVTSSGFRPRSSRKFTHQHFSMGMIKWLYLAHRNPCFPVVNLSHVVKSSLASAFWLVSCDQMSLVWDEWDDLVRSWKEMIVIIQDFLSKLVATCRMFLSHDNILDVSSCHTHLPTHTLLVSIEGTLLFVGTWATVDGSETPFPTTSDIKNLVNNAINEASLGNFSHICFPSPSFGWETPMGFSHWTFYRVFRVVAVNNHPLPLESDRIPSTGVSVSEWDPTSGSPSPLTSGASARREAKARIFVRETFTAPTQERWDREMGWRWVDFCRV